MGTGSNGIAMVGGKQFQVSGWGGEISDEASGNWVGREAIRRALWAQDGRAAMTPLAAAVLARFGDSGEAIADFAKTARPTDFASLFPLVLEHAEKRDPLGLALIGEAAADATRMIRRLLDVGAPTVCLIGGVAEKLTPWLPPPIRARLSDPRGDALDGAILMARRSRCGMSDTADERKPDAARGARGAGRRGAAARGERRRLPRARRAAARKRRRPSPSAARAAAPTPPRPSPNICSRSGSAS